MKWLGTTVVLAWSIHLPAFAADPAVVDLVDGTSLHTASSALNLPLQWVHENTEDDGLTTVEDISDKALESLSKHPLVEAAERSQVYQASSVFWGEWTPNDPLYPKQWNLHRIHAASGWQVGGGQGITVAIIDTGIRAIPDLEGTSILDGISFVENTKDTTDNNGHGTHVAGTIAQTTDNEIGVAGVAPNSTLLPIKVLGADGFGRSEWIAAAIDEACDRGANVLNLSLGGPQSEVVSIAVQKALKRGVLIVAAAGNTGQEGVQFPAALPGVLAVSAVGPGDELAPYSTWGSSVAISAPGGDKSKPDGGILQGTIDNDFGAFQGTSMAAPHVSGALAALLGAGASPDQARQLLLATATDLGEPGPDPHFGQGRLDLAAAVGNLLINHRGWLFFLGALLTLGVSWIGRFKGARQMLAVGVGGLSAGGAFFLPLLPLRPGLWTATLAQPFIAWPGLVLPWFQLIWYSAFIPFALTFVLGPTKRLCWIPMGGACGAAIALVHLDQAPVLPGMLGTSWLFFNAAICLFCALAVAGIQKQTESA